VAGWVTFHAGRLLKAGESVEVQGFRATVRRLRSHRIEQVQFERLPPENQAGNNAFDESSMT